jgi:hypothetical protein
LETVRNVILLAKPATVDRQATASLALVVQPLRTEFVSLIVQSAPSSIPTLPVASNVRLSSVTVFPVHPLAVLLVPEAIH